MTEPRQLEALASFPFNSINSSQACGEPTRQHGRKPEGSSLDSGVKAQGSLHCNFLVQLLAVYPPVTERPCILNSFYKMVWKNIIFL